MEDLNNRADNLSAELTRLLKQQAELEENTVRLHREGVGEDRLQRAQQQREAMRRKIDTVMKKSADIQKEIKAKKSLLLPH